MNLPGQTTYNPRLSWGSKVKKTKEGEWCVANDMKTYVDDVRTTRCNKEECRRTTHVDISRAQRSGQQDAPRKRQ